jgi:HSP20 family protein
MPKKKGNDDMGDEMDLFGTFDDELAEMRERMDRILDAFMRNELGPERAPLVYGFSMRTGEDGEPVVQEFGNSPKPSRIGSGQPEEREPLIDVIESDELVRVIVELPGAKKDDIRIDANERSLEIDLDRSQDSSMSGSPSLATSSRKASRRATRTGCWRYR